MSKVVLDASALLAVLNKESGAEYVESVLPQAVISSVNVSEVAAVLNQIGIASHDVEKILTEILREIIPFSAEHALMAGNLRNETASFGLSLGDRACLALGKFLKVPVVTADKVWSKLNMGLEIKVIR